jgi:hypothetical protein
MLHFNVNSLPSFHSLCPCNRNSYRQRNVFLYPPQISSMCGDDKENLVVGNGECGVNGNTKIFQAGKFQPVLSFVIPVCHFCPCYGLCSCYDLQKPIVSIPFLTTTNHIIVPSILDQSAKTCPGDEGNTNGNIDGTYSQGPFELPTSTQLVGKDNALLYQGKLYHNTTTSSWTL